MVLRNSLVILLTALSISAVAQSKLPLFITKQDIRNIRFISSDGAMTYYQRANGTLQFSTNYKVKEVLKLAPLTQYMLDVTPNKKTIAIQADEHFHQAPSLRRSRSIYLMDYGTSEAKKVASGIMIGLHGQYDQWLSYYTPYSRRVDLMNTVNNKITHQIKLSPKTNPFFIPQVAMIRTDLFVFTDIDNKNRYGIRLFNNINNTTTTLYKSSENHKRIDICKNDQYLYIRESAFDTVNSGTRITSIPIDQFKIDQQKFIYQSPHNDIGQLECKLTKDTLYFIKTLKSKAGKYTFEAAKLNVKTKKTDIISDVKFATSLVTIDNKLLLPYQGKYYTLLGNNNMTQFDLLERKENNAP